MLSRSIRRLCTFNTFRRQLEHPGQNQRNRQTDYYDYDNRADHPVRNVEDGKHLRDSLRKSPTGDNVGDRNLVNIASLQLREEVFDLHRLTSWGFASNAEEYLKSSEFAS